MKRKSYAIEVIPGIQAGIAFTWLLHLRWGAVAAQIFLALLALIFLEVSLPFWIIASILVFEVISNILLCILKRMEPALTGLLFTLIMFLDAVLLTLLLYYSGGPFNPFTFLYLVHITLGAILMLPVWSWILAIFTTGCYAILFLLPPATSLHCQPEVTMSGGLADPLNLHLRGMWVAFAVTTFFIVFFVSRVQMALSRQQQALAALRDEKSKSEKMASLATLAAGAAHEFATPLSTIAVAAGEMLHFLKEQGAAGQFPELFADVNLIRDQVTRCKDILFNLAADAGEQLGEPFSDFSLAQLLENLIQTLPAGGDKKLQYLDETGGLMVRMPFRTLRRIVRGLIKNALDACPEGSVVVRSWMDNGKVHIEVTDFGPGMSAEVIARATEPFFTTKEPGKGLGLGLFLAKATAERFDGILQIISKPGQGTTVRVSLALDKIVPKILLADGEGDLGRFRGEGVI